MATNFWTKIAIKWFCVKDSDRLWRGVSVVGRQNADIANTLQLRDVAMATTFLAFDGL